MLHFAAFFLLAGLLWYFLPSRTAEMHKQENEGFLFRIVAHPDCPIIVEPCQEEALGNSRIDVSSEYRDY